MVKLVDTPDLKSVAARRAGSTPATRTKDILEHDWLLLSKTEKSTWSKRKQCGVVSNEITIQKIQDNIITIIDYYFPSEEIPCFLSPVCVSTPLGESDD